MTNYVNAGTASVTNGTKTITFAGVSVALIQPGDLFQQGGASGIIDSVNVGAGTAQLVDNWGGTTASAAAYTVMTIPDDTEMANKVRTILDNLAGPLLTIAALTGDDFPANGSLLIAQDGDWATVGSTGSDEVVRKTGATISGPTLAGTVTGPDDGTWTTNGLDSVVALGVGASIGGWASSFKAEIKSTSNALSAYSTGSAGNNAITARIDSTSNFLTQFYYQTSMVAQFNSDGTNVGFAASTSHYFTAGNTINNIAGGTGGVTLTSGATSWAAVSDYRAKDVLGDYAGAGDIVDAVPVHRAKYNIPDMPTDERAMFLAHEVQAQVVYAVDGAKDAVDADGKPKYQVLLSTDPLLPILWAAVQETRATSRTLEARIAALESAP